ncbi:MAG: hypothetical protein U1F41_17465 [Burkholderiales bacterium]
MKLRHIALTAGLALASAGTALAQTAVVVAPAVRADPNAPIVVMTPIDAVIHTPGNANNLPVGQHYAVDLYGHRIVVDDAFDPARPEHRSTFDSSVDKATNTVTSPGYMGPRDTTGQ